MKIQIDEAAPIVTQQWGLPQLTHRIEVEENLAFDISVNIGIWLKMNNIDYVRISYGVYYMGSKDATLFALRWG